MGCGAWRGAGVRDGGDWHQADRAATAPGDQQRRHQENHACRYRAATAGQLGLRMVHGVDDRRDRMSEPPG
jgi:hypothetical protein